MLGPIAGLYIYQNYGFDDSFFFFSFLIFYELNFTYCCIRSSLNYDGLKYNRNAVIDQYNDDNSVMLGPHHRQSSSTTTTDRYSAQIKSLKSIGS